MKTTGKKATEKAHENPYTNKGFIPTEVQEYDKFRSFDTLDYFWPLLTLDPKTATIEDFITVKQWDLLSPLMEKGPDFISSQLKKHCKEALPYLRETVEYLQRIVFIASVDHDLPTEEVEQVETWIKETLTNSEGVVVLWERPGKTFVGTMTTAINRWDWIVRYLRVLAVKEITYSFRAGFNKKPEILNSFSACPICRVLIRKTRKDQVFCSRKCQNVEMQRRNRAKKPR